MRSSTAAIQTVAPPMPVDAGTNGGPPEQALDDRLKEFVGQLEDEARRRVDRRHIVEQRWLDDLRQYHGVYDPDVQKRINDEQGSKVFIGLTATKTDAMEARLWDLLFPTDDRNWGIDPTPVPDLADAAEAALKKVDDARRRGDVAQAEATRLQAAGDMEGAVAAEGQMRAAEDEESAAQAAADQLQERVAEARRRCDLMQEEIDDQLVGCRYQSEARDVISDACKIGMGVIKGPVLNEKPAKRWRRGQEGQHALAPVADHAPGAHRVDPWSFFPDPDVRRVVDSERNLERHMMTASKLRRLAMRPDIDKDAVREILREKPDMGKTPAYMADLSDLTGQSDGQIRDFYQVWEFTGPLDAEDMGFLAGLYLDGEGGADDEMDPLLEHHARILFCQGRILSFALYPLDSGEPLYSAFTIRPDEHGPFGFGIPAIMRHPQKVLNGAYRMMMDNSGFSTAPQIVVNKDTVQPQDGNWTLTPRKIWIRNSSQSIPGNPPFETFDIPSHQPELAAIIELASLTIDEVTAMPRIAQGEQGTGVTKTAQGMALLMNSANVTFRRIVKNFDDDITTPLIRRFYDWNMQFSRKEEIKGDYEVKARGSGVLLVREMQAQNLLMIAQTFGDHPTYGPMLKNAELLRAIFRAHMIPAAEITKTDREYKKDLEEQAQQPDPAIALEMERIGLEKAKVELAREELQQKTEIANMEWDKRLQIANLNYDAAMETAAAKLNMSREELDAKIAEGDRKARSDERKLAAEIAMREDTGVSAGGSV